VKKDVGIQNKILHTGEYDNSPAGKSLFFQTADFSGRAKGTARLQTPERDYSFALRRDSAF
jgi:hypothetical protein